MYKHHNHTQSRTHVANPSYSYTFSHPPREQPHPFHRTYSFPESMKSNTATAVPLPFETLTAPEQNRLAEKVAQATEPKPERSKRFLNSRLFYTSMATNGKDTFITLSSSNSTWGTVCNSLTLGLAAPLCRVYYVELMFQDKLIHDGEIDEFLMTRLGFKAMDDGITGEDLAKWLERQAKHELKTVSFEKMQGNCFAVYCITIPCWQSAMPEALVLRTRASKKYQILDGFDSVLMLLGRFHNSVWAVFK